jgi:hypothetical protein
LIIMAAAKQFTCPTCGFSVATPVGLSDLMKHVTLHKETNHPDMQMSESELMARVKDVELSGMAPESKGNFEFDDKLKEGAHKVGDEIKGLGSKIKKKIE